LIPQFIIFHWNLFFNYKPFIIKISLNKKNCTISTLIQLIEYKINYNKLLISYRRSCRETVCGSCSGNVNGNICLFCVTSFSKIIKICVYPLPHTFFRKSFINTLQILYKIYKNIKIYNNIYKYNAFFKCIHYSWNWYRRSFCNIFIRDYLYIFQLYNLLLRIYIVDLLKYLYIYQCILCFCCSNNCPSYWWNFKNYIGPANVLQLYKWFSINYWKINNFSSKILSSLLNNNIGRCHNIKNCIKACPKGLNPQEFIYLLKI